jgi:hypothetical protein
VTSLHTSTNTVVVTPVPEPSTILLLLSGLAVGARRGRKIWLTRADS